jgi:hypothetical protein
MSINLCKTIDTRKELSSLQGCIQEKSRVHGSWMEYLSTFSILITQMLNYSESILYSRSSQCSTLMVSSTAIIVAHYLVLTSTENGSLPLEHFIQPSFTLKSSSRGFKMKERSFCTWIIMGTAERRTRLSMLATKKEMILKVEEGTLSSVCILYF